ncbi:hypothetical protein NP233_g746 [Leucocoprinus birnbaumii]|uniref:DNA replication ATP-dependent helicase/nuclease DNA2 n=1 Tax=Leucocoprinus birnbaumii TaxID=56174 RepID=A0AAD5W2C1_9AGAR|nr:hypothetical protein NP233_g746 [Leucocoprinus birnbaumii]
MSTAYTPSGLHGLPPRRSRVTGEEIQFTSLAGRRHTDPASFAPATSVMPPSPQSTFLANHAAWAPPPTNAAPGGLMSLGGYAFLQVSSSSGAYVNREFPTEAYCQVRRHVNEMLKNPYEKTFRYKLLCAREVELSKALEKVDRWCSAHALKVSSFGSTREASTDLPPFWILRCSRLCLGQTAESGEIEALGANGSIPVGMDRSRDWERAPCLSHGINKRVDALSAEECTHHTQFEKRISTKGPIAIPTMPAAKVSRQDETDFMASLLSGLDNAHATSVQITPSKSKKPQKVERVFEKMKSPKFKTPTKPQGLSTTRAATNDLDISGLLDGADDWDWDDMNDFMTPQKAASSPKKAKSTPRPALGSPRKPLPQVPKREYQKAVCTRCVVESVSDVRMNGRYHKTLVVKLDSRDERRSVTLQDDWITTDVRLGDIINIIGPFEALAGSPSTSSITLTINITSRANYLVLHPDILITATALSNASQCRRKPLLSGLVRSTSDVTPALVWGNILHEVMQLCMSENRWEQDWVEERIEEIVRKNLVNIVRIEMTVEEATKEVKMRAKGLIAFADKYLGAQPKPAGVLSDTRSKSDDAQSLLAISDLLDVEEDIWSPTYGLKGKIDATVHSIISQPRVAAHPMSNFFNKSKNMKKESDTETVTGAVPFEIKTGRSVAGMEHRAQTMLYTLLVAERYHQEVDAGLLYYTQKEEVVRVPVVRNELRGLIMARNEMAAYMMTRHRLGDGKVNEDGVHVVEEEPFLPPSIDDERACKHCFVVDTCMLYRRAVENVKDTTSPIADTYNLKTSHLTSLQLEFFKKWERLISLEEKDIHRFKKELWTMGAKEREMKGRCFAGMILDEAYDPDAPSPSQSMGYHDAQVDSLEADLVNSGKDKIHKFTYRFIRSSQPQYRTQFRTQYSAVNEEEAGSLLSGHISVGEAITISVEPDLLALARGFVVDLTPSAVILGVDHELDLERIGWRLATRRQKLTPSQQKAEEIVFRIDKDDLFGGMARIRDNLAQLFYVEGDAKRLKLVVDLLPPAFESLDWLDDKYSNDRKEYLTHTAKLNANQKEAVKKVLSAKDYALILGMPGTGKTGVIASLVKVLVGMGKTVLVSAYTHSAVDNVLLRLKSESENRELDFGVLRLGNLDKIHPDVQEFTLAKRKQAVTVEHLEKQLMSPPVVATTCLSVDHALFNRRKFDYCIVDEASQITLPTCLGPIRYAERFVLVGDHFQLPPLVRSVQARQGGLDVSLFRRLSDSHPNAVVELADQYRMNEEIMTLSNRLIYGERLRCGSESVRTRKLTIPKWDAVKRLCEHATCTHSTRQPHGCWLRQLLDENCKAIFVDTDGIPGHESRAGDLIQNEVEAELVRQVTEALIVGGVSPDQVGIITLYRQQVKLILHLLGGRKDVEILTADRSQGRDKDVVIFSMVRSNDEGKTGDLVKDWRRMNVSFTRARSKLIIFGSRQTLQATPLLKEFFGLMDEKGWVLSMPDGAHTFHSSVLRDAPGVANQVAEPTGMKNTFDDGDDDEIEVIDHPMKEAQAEMDSMKPLTPSKRSSGADEKENASDSGSGALEKKARPVKKARKSHGIDSGIVKGKPMLLDLINDSL